MMVKQQLSLDVAHRACSVGHETTSAPTQPAETCAVDANQLERRTPKYERTAEPPGDVSAAVTITHPSRRSRADSDLTITAELEAGLDHGTHVLHGREVPNTRGHVDHVIVAPSGVWIVDTKSYWGLVEKRDMGNWRTVDHRLFVNGRDQTDLVDDLNWQITGLCAVLERLGLGDVPIHPVLLFVGSSGRWFTKPIEIDGVRAMWTKKLLEFVAESGPLDEATCRTIVTELAAQLPTTA